MKKVLLTLPIFALLFCGCNGELSSSSTFTPANEGTITTSKTTNDCSIKIDLNLSNFNRYICYKKCEGYTGAAGFSSYEGWLEFNGLLAIGVYDVTVTYEIDSIPHDFKLDVSGSGKTDYFDRNASCEIILISGSISYLEPNTKIDLDLSNFGDYIGYSKVEGYTGVPGYSSYEAWLEFKGLLNISVYDVAVTYVIDSVSYDFKLDVSGGGKTEYFDRGATYEITEVSGSVKYNI